MKHSNKKLTLPDGFMVCGIISKDSFTIENKNGAVTIFPDRRNYCLGYSGFCQNKHGEYTGRGWLQKLVNDAIENIK